MNAIAFQNQLSSFPVFSLEDARKSSSDFSYRQIDRWAKKGYLRKIKRGFYTLEQHRADEQFLFYTANKIYSPSYISLETALKYYGLIPEEVFQLTSVSTKKTTKFYTPVGNYSYRHIKPELFFGYRIVESENHQILLAEPEKAILDYLYLNSFLKTADDFRSLRINREEFFEQINLERFKKMITDFDFKALESRANRFLKTVAEHDA